MLKPTNPDKNDGQDRPLFLCIFQSLITFFSSYNVTISQDAVELGLFSFSFFFFKDTKQAWGHFSIIEKFVFTTWTANMAKENTRMWSETTVWGNF